MKSLFSNILMIIVGLTFLFAGNMYAQVSARHGRMGSSTTTVDPSTTPTSPNARGARTSTPEGAGVPGGGGAGVPGGAGEPFHVFEKNVPVQINPEVTGKGTPTYLFVVQLARFEDMLYIPEEFPVGSFLWMNPDHPTEKILYSGFYLSTQEAEEAALEWRKDPMFESAFVKPAPWLVRYD